MSVVVCPRCGRLRQMDGLCECRVSWRGLLMVVLVAVLVIGVAMACAGFLKLGGPTWAVYVLVTLVALWLYAAILGAL